jgi:hypothetical protein
VRSHVSANRTRWITPQAVNNALGMEPVITTEHIFLRVPIHEISTNTAFFISHFSIIYFPFLQHFLYVYFYYFYF